MRYVGGVFSSGLLSCRFSFAEIASEANLGQDSPEGMDPALDETAFFSPKGLAYAHGTISRPLESMPRPGAAKRLRCS